LTSSGAGTTRSAQGTAAAAWAANCRMTLPKMLGHALGVAGAGSGLTSRTMGVSVGTETQTLITANLPPYTPAGIIASSGSFSGAPLGPFTGNPGGTTLIQSGGGTVGVSVSSTFTGTPQGGTSTAFSIMQPSQFLNAIVKT